VSRHPLDALQEWYSAQCDDEWEHEYGVKVNTLDNPGWSLRVDLVRTPLEGRQLPREKSERYDDDDDDWFTFWSDGKTFDAAGGRRNLGDLIAAFVRFANLS
jgi:hypothetical protein